MFIYGVYKYFIQGGAEEEKVQEGQRFVMWSVIGFALMFSIWGLINLLINSFGLDNTSRPALPTFGVSGSSAMTGTNALFPTYSGSVSTLPTGLSVGSSVTSNGTTYTALSAVNGACPNGGTYNGSVCIVTNQASNPIQSMIQSIFGGNSTTAKGGTVSGGGAGSGSGTVQPGSLQV